MNYKEEVFVKNKNDGFILKKRKISIDNEYKNKPLNSFLNYICNNNYKPIISKKELLDLTKLSTIMNENKKIR